MDKRDQNLLSILLVDDDEDEFILLQGLMSDPTFSVDENQYNLEWVPTYEDALHISEKVKPDVYLIDYRLGSHSGLDLLHELEARGNRAPVIVLTGYANYEVDTAAMEAGASDFLQKDQINPQILERSIRYALIQKQVEEELEQRVRRRTRALEAANRKLKAEIQERVQAQEGQRNSEQRFRKLAETTSAAIFIIRDMEIRYANPAARLITGYDPEELIGESFLTFVHPGYRGILRQYGLGNQWAADMPSRYEMRIITKEGQERWLDVTAGSMEYEGQSAWIVTAFDITERDLAERELRKAKSELEHRVAERTLELQQANEQLTRAAVIAQKRVAELDALNHATGALLVTIDLEVLLDRIVGAVAEAVPASRHCVLSLLDTTGDMQVRSASSIEAYRIASEDEVFRELIRSTVAEKQALLIGNAAESLHLTLQQGAGGPIDHEGLQIGSVMLAPLLLGDRPLGVLLLVAPEPDSFNDADLRLLVSFATTSTAALNNATLHAEMQRLAVTDALTGRYNRRGFFDLGEREVNRSLRFSRPLSVVVIDVDLFKEINDTYGHSAGDQVLRVLMDRCCSHIRQVDLLGRLGGDEFAILMPETTLEKARDVAGRIRDAVSGSPVLTEAGEVKLTISLGAAQLNEKTLNLGSLLNQADAALYQAKQKGRNRLELSWVS